MSEIKITTVGRFTQWILSGLFCLTITSCAGAFGKIKFDDLAYPASMSGYLYNAFGAVVSLNDMEVMGVFSFQKRFFGVFYSAIPLTGSFDIGSIMNREIKKLKADGIVNVTVKAVGCRINSVPLMVWLPLWPGCAKVEVSGLIVKLIQPATSIAEPVENRRQAPQFDKKYVKINF